MVSAHLVLAAGFTPYFVDIDPLKAMPDPSDCERQLRDAPGRRALFVMWTHYRE
ncbi:hypothetical protein [Asticcacaulis currens]|uniref:hypothetical protein n=1 Tax=Asticcacaulis currens TaxID=2984210 RepID=UPI0034A27766